MAFGPASLLISQVRASTVCRCSMWPLCCHSCLAAPICCSTIECTLMMAIGAHTQPKAQPADRVNLGSSLWNTWHPGLSPLAFNASSDGERLASMLNNNADEELLPSACQERFVFWMRLARQSANTKACRPGFLPSSALWSQATGWWSSIGCLGFEPLGLQPNK